MLLLDYYISPDYNSLLNIRHSLLKWCKSNSFLLKHQSKTLQHTENININIADCMTVQQFQKTVHECFPYSRRLFVFVHQELFPFQGPAAAASYCSSWFLYTATVLPGQCCGKPTDQPFVVGVFMSHYVLGSDVRKTFFLPWKQPLRQEVGRGLFSQVKACYLVLTVSCAAAVVPY